VLNKDEELNRLSKFIGLNINVANLDNVELANRRGIINTPSYSQVSKPLYKGAIDRWKSYTQYLKEVDEIISPIAKKFDYTLI
jgi:hypothetical protein